MSLIQPTIYDIFTILLALITCIVGFLKWKFTYWSRRNVYTLPPSLPFGNLQEVFLRKKSFANVMMDIYRVLKSKQLKYGGMYFITTPAYVPLDLDIIKSILLKDFDHFVNHGGYVDEEADPLSGNLFALENEKWRNLRVRLTPTFTSGKMKMMFETLVDCTHELKAVMTESWEKKLPVDIKDVLARFSVDIIGSCAFGIECNSLKNPDSAFSKVARQFSEPSFIQNLRNLISILPRRLLKTVGFRLNTKHIEDFFINIVKDTIDHREKNNIYRKDFMHLLLQLKNRGEIIEDENIMADVKPGTHLTLPEITAQCFLFLVAGFETSSALNTFTLYELSKNPNVQDKLREEINTVIKKYEGKLTYKAIKEMTYMDQVLQEALRKYPPLPLLFRVCNKQYPVPGESIVIEEGTMVIIPVIGIQRDPEYYPDPEKFDPDRFSEGQKGSRHPHTWLPFGDGPRYCIGNRFGLMQAKVGLVTLVKNFRLSVNEKTKEPLEFNPDAFLLSAKGKIWLNLEKIEQSYIDS